jgi:hypothetical protein
VIREAQLQGSVFIFINLQLPDLSVLLGRATKVISSYENVKSPSPPDPNGSKKD